MFVPRSLCRSCLLSLLIGLTSASQHRNSDLPRHAHLTYDGYNLATANFGATGWVFNPASPPLVRAPSPPLPVLGPVKSTSNLSPAHATPEMSQGECSSSVASSRPAKSRAVAASSAGVASSSTPVPQAVPQIKAKSPRSVRRKISEAVRNPVDTVKGMMSTKSRTSSAAGAPSPPSYIDYAELFEPGRYKSYNDIRVRICASRS